MRRFLAALLIALAALASVQRAEAEDDSLAAIKARGKLIAGVKFDTPPFGFLDESNQPVGFDIDLVREIGKHLGVPVELVAVTSPTRIPMLVSGNVDLVAASMTRTPEREQAIDFSITYYTGGQSLLVPSSSKITGVQDLAGKPVAVQQGTTLEKNLAAAAPKAEIVAFKDYNSAWLALRQGRVDALTGSLNILQGFAKDNPRLQDRGITLQRRALRHRHAQGRHITARGGQPHTARSLDLRRLHGALSQMVRQRSDDADRDGAEVTSIG